MAKDMGNDMWNDMGNGMGKDVGSGMGIAEAEARGSRCGACVWVCNERRDAVHV